MIHLKVEQIGDRVAVILDAESQQLLGVGPGDTLILEEAGDAVRLTSADAVARGKAFVERYIRTFEALAK